MILIPVLVMDLILLVATILLIIADHFLVNYGECRITVKQGDDKKEIKVKGGSYLLSYLNDNGFDVSSSCGGKATCGYCKMKVLNGGGQILPTEEIFMSREEKLDNMRLACQVKVKNDIEIYIPDYLTTVINIVKNRLYDTRLKWDFSIASQTKNVPEERTITKKIVEKDKINTSEIINGQKDSRGITMPVLQSVNTAYGYLPENVLWHISQELKIPLSSIFNVATFYDAFSLERKGKHIINVCMGTTCHVKGAPLIVSALERELNVRVGETTKDMNFTLETVNCLGCCGLAPVMTIGDDLYGKLTQAKIPKILEKYKNS